MKYKVCFYKYDFLFKALYVPAWPVLSCIISSEMVNQCSFPVTLFYCFIRFTQFRLIQSNTSTCNNFYLHHGHTASFHSYCLIDPCLGYFEGCSRSLLTCTILYLLSTPLMSIRVESQFSTTIHHKLQPSQWAESWIHISLNQIQQIWTFRIRSQQF